MVSYKECVTNEKLAEKLNEDSTIILDVRETEEHARKHIPGSVLIPLRQLEERCEELADEGEIFVICESGVRSEMACRILKAKGFKYVYNVVPGMIAWAGPTDSVL